MRVREVGGEVLKEISTIGNVFTSVEGLSLYRTFCRTNIHVGT